MHRSCIFCSARLGANDAVERFPGEMAMREAMWRQAEEIAGIAGRLPDVAPGAPRLSAEG